MTIMSASCARLGVATYSSGSFTRAHCLVVRSRFAFLCSLGSWIRGFSHLKIVHVAWEEVVHLLWSHFQRVPDGKLEAEEVHRRSFVPRERWTTQLHSIRRNKFIFPYFRNTFLSKRHLDFLQFVSWKTEGWKMMSTVVAAQDEECTSLLIQVGTDFNSEEIRPCLQNIFPCIWRNKSTFLYFRNTFLSKRHLDFLQFVSC